MSLLTDFFPKAGGGGGIDSQTPNAELAIVGGGGGSGAAGDDRSGASGGEILRGCIYLAPQCTYTVTIGAGGAAGGTDPLCIGLPTGVGSPGGTTCFGKYKAYGGAGALTIDTAVLPTGCPAGDRCLTACDCGFFAMSANNGLGGTGAYMYVGCCAFSATIQQTCSVRFCRNGVVGGNFQMLTDMSDSINFLANSPAPNPQIVDVYPYGQMYSIFGNRRITDVGVDDNEARAPYLGPTLNCTNICRTNVCNSFYGLEIGGAPYDSCHVGSYTGPGACPTAQLVPTICIPNADYLPQCYRFGTQNRYDSAYHTGFPSPDFPPQYREMCCGKMLMQCNYSNMGTASRCTGCSGDSGIAVIVYDCSLGAATAPGGIDCTPVTGPQGYRSYVFNGPGTFTLP